MWRVKLRLWWFRYSDVAFGYLAMFGGLMNTSRDNPERLAFVCLTLSGLALVVRGPRK